MEAARKAKEKYARSPDRRDVRSDRIRQRLNAILHGGCLEVRHRTTSVLQEHLGDGSGDSEYGDGGKDAIEIGAPKWSDTHWKARSARLLGC